MGSVPINDVKTAWGHELHGFAGRLEAIAWALENLPERCPNVIEFRNLCRKAPEPEEKKLPEPAINPERLRSELAKLIPAVQAARKAAANDGLAWARRIVGRYDGGDKVPPACLKLARDALSRNGVAS